MKPTIFDNEQYRIYIPFRKSIDFESKLCEANIEYWTDSEMQTASVDIRFYFNKKDAAGIGKNIEGKYLDKRNGKGWENRMEKEIENIKKTPLKQMNK